jgi:hypothetical protein
LAAHLRRPLDSLYALSLGYAAAVRCCRELCSPAHASRSKEIGSFAQPASFDLPSLRFPQAGVVAEVDPTKVSQDVLPLLVIAPRALA